MRAALNRDLQRGAGLTLAENLLLCQVAMAPGQRLRMADIAGLLPIGPSAVTKTADRLEERGLITRDRGPADRRTVYAALTAEGENAFAAARPAYLAAVQRHFAGQLTETQILHLQHLSERIMQPALGTALTSSDQVR